MSKREGKAWQSSQFKIIWRSCWNPRRLRLDLDDDELCFCLCKYMFLMFLADDGCGRKRKTEAGSKAEDCMNPDSSVMTAFKGETVVCCAPDEPVLYMYCFVFILWQYSSKNSTPSMINTSVWWKSVEISPLRANGPYSSCTESPGEIQHLLTVSCTYFNSHFVCF